MLSVVRDVARMSDRPTAQRDRSMAHNTSAIRAMIPQCRATGRVCPGPYRNIGAGDSSVAVRIRMQFHADLTGR